MPSTILSKQAVWTTQSTVGACLSDAGDQARHGAIGMVRRICADSMQYQVGFEPCAHYTRTCLMWPNSSQDLPTHSVPCFSIQDSTCVAEAEFRGSLK